MKIVLALAVATLSSVATAAEVRLKMDSVKYTVGMSGDHVDSTNVKARVLGVDIGVMLKDAITEDLYYHARLAGNFENGTNKATGLTAEYEPNQAVNLWEGGLVYTPTPYLRLEAGALNQNKYASPLLVWNTAFAGATQELRYQGLYVRAQQAIPNNNILSRRIGGIEEGTPLFFMETLGFDYDDNHLRFKAEASRFSFNDLSSQVALTSQDFGNSVVGANQSARFLYGFRGTNISGELSYTTTESYKVMLGGQYIFNEGAPEKRNQGYLAEVGAGMNGVLLKVGQFRNESDSAPAFYNARLYGHNNMQGTVVTLQGQSKELTFRVQAVQGRIIEQNIRQSDMNIINFAIVRHYEL